jgi:23S rRNA (uracil1939-C5)-methyltransferase
MRVEIEKIVHGGYGIARSGGRTLLIPFSVPGDLLDIECGEGLDRNFGWIKQVVRPSHRRRESACPVFTICGGCDFDHMDYRLELEVKRGIVLEDLARIGGIEPKAGIEAVASDEYGYRNHAQFKVDSSGRVGFFEKKSHSVVPLPEMGCLLLQKEINDCVNGIRKSVQFRRGGFRIRADGSGNVYTKGVPGREDDDYYRSAIGGLRFRTNIDDFFQVNTLLIERWLELIRSFVQPSCSDMLTDLYCGSGVISLHLAPYVKSVTGIELNPNAVDNALFNAKTNGISNVRFIRSTAQGGIRKLHAGGKIVVDPPRSGLGSAFVEGICRLKPRAVVYVSCDTATFARDLNAFRERGYELSEIRLVDMFPRTRHIELVSRILPGRI